MPTYDYVCEECDERFEVVEGIWKAEPVECPKCHSKNVKRQFPRPSMVVIK